MTLFDIAKVSAAAILVSSLLMACTQGTTESTQGTRAGPSSLPAAGSTSSAPEDSPDPTAEQIVRENPEVRSWLNEVSIAEVSVTKGARFTRVEIRLESDVPLGSWPVGYCSIGVPNPDKISGAAFHVDMEAEEVETMSPMWGTVDCLSEP